MKRELVVSCVLALTVLAPIAAVAQDASVAADAASVMSKPDHGENEKAANKDTATERDPHADQDPHAAGARGQMFEAPEDGAVDDPTIPAGSISAHISDAEGRPLPRTEVTLGILYNSVAKGESRKRVVSMTDDTGRARFDKLDTGSGVAYRVMVLRDGATFSAPPFVLNAKIGSRAVLHVYPVESDIDKTLVVAQAITYTEVKDDRVQIQQAYKIYNFGRNAWIPPSDLVIPLPPKFTAFSTQQGMTDVGVDAVQGKGIKIRGTFGPGQHVIEFRWQLPYGGEPEVRFDVGMPPHMAAARVMTPASRDMLLEVPGFPSPQPQTDGQGQRILITELQLKREDKPVTSVTVAVRGLPTTGPGRWIATFLAFGGLAYGVVLGAKKPAKGDRKKERGRLLDDLEALERTHAAGDVGPKTYERARRDLIDEIAHTFDDGAAKTASKAPAKSSPAKKKKKPS
jgi:hypothetical protein